MSYTIMVVDDEWPALEQMQQLLRPCAQIGEIHLYDNPREAFKAAVTLKPDVLFLDIQMPELSGLAFAEKLLPHSPVTNIVFVTAYRNYAVEAFELAAVDYLLKPVDPSRLSKAWSKLTGRLGADRDRSPSAPQAAGSGIELQCLGSYELKGPQGPVKWTTQKAGELFAYLWFRREGAVGVILNDVFPQSNYEKGKQYLHTTVYQIRKTLKNSGLGDQIEITFNRENYKLESSGLSSDAEKFGTLAAEALQSGDPDAMRKALALYGGELLLPVDSLWVYSYRDQYHSLYTQLLERVISLLLSQNRLQEAEDYAKRLIELDPLEEGYSLQLVAIYFGMGKPAKAQRIFTQFRKNYETELGEELPVRVLDEYRKLGT